MRGKLAYFRAMLQKTLMLLSRIKDLIDGPAIKHRKMHVYHLHFRKQNEFSIQSEDEPNLAFCSTSKSYTSKYDLACVLSVVVVRR